MPFRCVKIGWNNDKINREGKGYGYGNRNRAMTFISQVFKYFEKKKILREADEIYYS